MDTDQENDLARIKEDYLKSLRKSSIDISNGNQVQVQDFLYTVILNKQYDQLIQNYNLLNKEICKVLIYGHNLPSTSSALNILYAFLYFYIGSKVKIEELIDNSNDNPWDCFFNMCLYFIEGDINKTKLYKEKFEQLLTLSNKNHLALDSRASETKLQNLRNANQIVDFLIHIVYKDNSVTEKWKKKHFIESYNFLKEHKMIEEINDKTKKLKINIINAYLTKDYEYLKNIEVDDKNSLVIITYSLIQIDYKQFSVFLSRCNDKDRNYHIQQIKNHVDAVDRDYFKLVLVGRSLKKIGEWEKTIDLYEELIKSNEKIQSKQKYNVFLYFTVCKMKFMKGEIKQALETCKLALEEIDKFQKSKQLFYQPNTQRFIQMELLFLNLVLKYIQKDNKSKKRSIDQIKDKLLSNDNNNLRRNLNLLYQQFVEDIENKDISKFQYSEQSFKIIRNFFENQIQERLYFIQNQKKGLFSRSNKNVMNSSVILEQNKKKDIKLKYQCLLELYIITQYLKNQEYQIIYYLNIDYLTLFLNMITLEDLAIEPIIQAQIFRFFGEYQQCFRIAQTLNNYKLMAEVYFAQMNDDKAIDYYEKVQDAESHFLLGYLYFNKSDHEENQVLKQEYQDQAINQFQQAKLYSKIYQKIIRNRMMTLSILKDENEKGNEQFDVSTVIDVDTSNVISVSNNNFFQSQQIQQDNSLDISRKSTLDLTQSRIYSQPSRSNSTTISLNQDFKGRPDIRFFYKEVINELAPYYKKLIPQIEKFLYSTRRYEIESKTLIDGMVIENVIGKGSFGKVNKVIFQGEQYASKISSITFNSMRQEFKDNELKRLYSRINEINILSEIQDYKIPYVIQNKHIGFKFAQLNQEGLNNIKIFNLSPIYQPFSVIQAQNDKVKIEFAEKIAICLKQLQIRRISHQDIKPENVLVDDKNDPVLIDFGTSIFNFRSTLNGSNVFTQVYVDPELEQSGRKSRKNDVYSFGITLYDLFVCKRPFDDVTYYYEIEFLTHKKHLEEIQKIKIGEIQQLIHNCTQSNQNKRYSLSQVLYQFLMMNPCRNDILKLLKVFMLDFQDVDISDQEYELIKEFQQISLKIELMNSQQIQQVEQVNETMFKCEYQDNQLQFYKYDIVIQNKQLAFKQILQCMRFIRNHVYLNEKNVQNITRFYNYRLILQENGQEKSIQFDIYSLDNCYKSGYSNSQEQLITILKTIEQINEHGLYIKALANEFLQFQNDTPILTNLLYSFRYQDDSFKNQLGWTYINMIQDNSYVYENRNQQIGCLKTYFEQFIINMKTRSTLRKSVIKKTKFEETLEYIINNINTFGTIYDIINLIVQPEKQEQIDQEVGQK